MNHQHTPGPWLVQFELDDLDSAASVLRVVEPTTLDHPQGPVTIASVNVAAHAPHLDEPLANAALIAAAPALLLALRDLVDLDSNQAHADAAGIKHWREGIAVARAALFQALEPVHEHA